MTIASDVIGLLPIMWASGTGADTMQRIAAPLMGGSVTAALVVLFGLPLLYAWVHGRRPEQPDRAAELPPPLACPSAVRRRLAPNRLLDLLGEHAAGRLVQVDHVG